MPTVDAVIVGQGLAGTALAWTFIQRDIDFVLIDDGLPNTSSRIAAGLVTPITGKRAVMSWAWEEAWGVAQPFYSDIESKVDVSFWCVHPSLRLFESEAERASIEPRLSHCDSGLVASFSPNKHGAESKGRNFMWDRLPACHFQRDRLEAYPTNFPHDAKETSDSSSFAHDFGGFVMRQSARLDTPTYLNASRIDFQTRNACLSLSLDIPNDIECEHELIRIPKLDIETRKIIFCQGYVPESNPWFPNLPLVPAQGDILKLDIPSLHESRTIHRGIWITPIRQSTLDATSSQYLVGSTYRWRPLDGLPSSAGRDEILSKLQAWMKLPFEVVDHRSAIRPASFDQRPLFGPSSQDPRVWVFNGLGAKGALLAPWCAQHLVACLFDGVATPEILRWDRRWS